MKYLDGECRSRLAGWRGYHSVITPATPGGEPFVSPHVDTVMRDQEAAYLEAVSDRIAAVWEGPVIWETYVERTGDQGLLRRCSPS